MATFPTFMWKLIADPTWRMVTLSGPLAPSRIMWGSIAVGIFKQDLLLQLLGEWIQALNSVNQVLRLGAHGISVDAPLLDEAGCRLQRVNVGQAIPPSGVVIVHQRCGC